MAKCINVGLVDDHNEALNFYYKLIARKKIPFKGLCLVHFDSHPDLALPETIPVNQVSRFVIHVFICDYFLIDMIGYHQVRS